ncbi:hypothetical protein [Brasilonema sp. UFV-L1]
MPRFKEIYGQQKNRSCFSSEVERVCLDLVTNITRQDAGNPAQHCFTATH